MNSQLTLQEPPTRMFYICFQIKIFLVSARRPNVFQTPARLSTSSSVLSNTSLYDPNFDYTGTSYKSPQTDHGLYSLSGSGYSVSTAPPKQSKRNLVQEKSKESKRAKLEELQRSSSSTSTKKVKKNPKLKFSSIEKEIEFYYLKEKDDNEFFAKKAEKGLVYEENGKKFLMIDSNSEEEKEDDEIEIPKTDALITPSEKVYMEELHKSAIVNKPIKTEVNFFLQKKTSLNNLL